LAAQAGEHSYDQTGLTGELKTDARSGDCAGFPKLGKQPVSRAAQLAATGDALIRNDGDCVRFAEQPLLE